jgi:hypothetical protein
MVWKQTTTVAFAIRDTHVVARFCDVAAPELTEAKKQEYLNNVKEDCIKDGHDVCFQSAALRAHNDKRARHRGGSPLLPYNEASKYL